MGRIDLADVGNIDRFYQDALKINGQKSLIEEELSRLTKDKREITEDKEKVSQGIAILCDWLKEQTGSSKGNARFSIFVLISGIVAISATLLLGKAVIWIASLTILILLAEFIRNLMNRQNLLSKQSVIGKQQCTIFGK